VVKATILRYGPLGASVSISEANSIVVENQQQMGLILQDQIEYWAALNKRDPQVGEVVNAYIQKIREDGKMDIALRPVGYDKVTNARDQLLTKLESMDGILPIGDKSSPEDIWKLLPGMSKAQYKAGI
jgi:hypothetical protein